MKTAVLLFTAMTTLLTACTKSGFDNAITSKTDKNKVPDSWQEPLPSPTSEQLKNHTKQHAKSFLTKFDSGLSFYSWGNKFVPIDIERQNVKLSVDAESGQIKVYAELHFSSLDSGLPYLALQQKNVSLEIMELESKEVSQAELIDILDPTGEERYSAMSVEVQEGRKYLARLNYELFIPGGVTEGKIDIGSQQSDRSNDKTLAQFFPANYLSDKFQLTLDVSVKNSKSKTFFIANGKYVDSSIESESADKKWTVEFPEYMYSYGHFFHLTNSSLAIHQNEYVSSITGKKIPLLIYTEAADDLNSRVELLDDAQRRLVYLFTKYEKLLGEFAHNSLIFRLNHLNWDIGSMEYVGAMHSTFYVLEHEFVHNWFARGAFAGDNSGWADEAITMWLTDLGAYTSQDLIKREPVKLLFNSPLSRSTVQAAYAEGSKLLADLNLVLNFQLSNILSKFYSQFKLQSYTSDQLINHIYVNTPEEKLETVKYLVNRYVYGKNEPWNLNSVPFVPSEVKQENLISGIKTKVYKIQREIYRVGFLINQDLVKELIVPNLNFEVKEEETFLDTNEKDASILAVGYLKITKEDNYKLILNSDDGARVDLSGRQILLNDWAHDMKQTESTIVHLTPGLYPIEIRWFDSGGGGGFLLQIEDSNKNKTRVDEKILFTEKL